MTDVLSAVGAVLLTAVAVLWWWPRATRRRRDHDWGDWPPDQRAR